jgi:nitrite reductase/ring-hydroxylating ferredoxin subunit
MTGHVVCDEDDLDPGDRVLVQVEGREIAVFNLDGEYNAFVNWCPHQGGPACEGLISGTREGSYDRETGEVSLEWTREDRILNCPWHGWEFDLSTGECLSRRPIRLPSYPVDVEDGKVVLELRGDSASDD